MAPRPRKPGKAEDAPTTLSFQVEAELIRKLEAEIEAHYAKKGHRPSRTQVVKELLTEAINARVEERKGKGK